MRERVVEALRGAATRARRPPRAPAGARRAHATRWRARRWRGIARIGWRPGRAAVAACASSRSTRWRRARAPGADRDRARRVAALRRRCRSAVRRSRPRSARRGGGRAIRSGGRCSSALDNDAMTATRLLAHDAVARDQWPRHVCAGDPAALRVDVERALRREISVAIASSPRAHSGRARCDAAAACRRRLRATSPPIRPRAAFVPAVRCAALRARCRRDEQLAAWLRTGGLAVDQERHVSARRSTCEPRLPGNGLRRRRVANAPPQGGVRRMACRAPLPCGAGRRAGIGRDRCRPLHTATTHGRSSPPRCAFCPAAAQAPRRRIRGGGRSRFRRGDAAALACARHGRRPERTAARDRQRASIICWSTSSRTRRDVQLELIGRLTRRLGPRRRSHAVRRRRSDAVDLPLPRGRSAAVPRVRRCPVRSPALRCDVVELTRNFRSQAADRRLGQCTCFAHVLPRASDAGAAKRVFAPSCGDPCHRHRRHADARRRANARRRRGHGRREGQSRRSKQA